MEIRQSNILKQRRVFICYCHREPDKRRALIFADALRKKGLDVFIDTEMEGGKEKPTEIRKMIEKCDHFFLLLSKEAAKAEEVYEEVVVAASFSRNIIPVRIQYPVIKGENLPERLAKYIGQLHPLRWDEEDHTNRIVEHILSISDEKADFSDTTNFSPKKHVTSCNSSDFSMIFPGKALGKNSHLYITRKEDKKVIDAISKPHSFVLLHGSHRTGKTSLIMRTHDSIKDIRSVLVDFDLFTEKDFQSSNSIWYAISYSILQQLESKQRGLSFSDQHSHDSNFYNFLTRFVFPANNSHLLICLDNVDLVFNYPIKDEFFRTIQSFYNRGSFNPTLRKIRWLVGVSYESRFFIKGVSQSSFNIGYPVKLNTFTYDEVFEFAKRHHLDLEDDVLNFMIKCVGGHPYLVHLILYKLEENPAVQTLICDIYLPELTKIREYFERYLMHFREEKNLADTMKELIYGIDSGDIRLSSRLEAAGIVNRDGEKLIPFCEFCANYFEAMI